LPGLGGDAARRRIMAATLAGSTNIPLAVFATRMRFSLAAFQIACLDTPTRSAACPALIHRSNS